MRQYDESILIVLLRDLNRNGIVLREVDGMSEVEYEGPAGLVQEWFEEDDFVVLNEVVLHHIEEED